MFIYPFIDNYEWHFIEFQIAGYVLQLAKMILQSLMQEPSLSSLLLPRRVKGEKTTTTKQVAKEARFCSNIFQIKLKNITPSIFQFSLDITPEIPADSLAIRQKIVHSIFFELKKLIGFVCHKGDMLWGRRNLTKPENLIAEFKKANEAFKFQVLVKPVKQVSLTYFMAENPEKIVAICQILNINTKNMLKSAEMIELNMGNYYDEKKINQNCSQYGLNVWRGYKVTVVPYNSRLFLQVDPCSRVLRQESFLATLEHERKQLKLEEINSKYTDSSILMKYGNTKVYKIESIDFKMNPNSKFYYAKLGKQITYTEYFKTKYAYSVKNEKQPMVRVLANKKRNIAAVKNVQNADEYIYLIPQMLVLTGITDAERSDFRIMKSLDPYTKLHPQERMKQTKKIIQKLQDQEELIFDINNQPYMINGYIYTNPQILLGGNKSIQIKNGNMNLRERVLDPHKFTSFIFCYSTGKSKQMDQDDADDALSNMKSACKTFGIAINQPYWLEVDNPRNFKDWQQQLQKQRSKCQEKVQVIIFFLKPFEEKLYPELKRYVTSAFGCPSQMIRKKSLSSKNKGVLSVASKIVLQMNAKLGHPLWQVPNYHKYWDGKKIAVAGIASSKGKKGTTIGIVGTTNPELTKYFCDCKKIQSRDNISAAFFQAMFVQWIQNYFSTNKKTLPEVLVIYRQGLNDVQARHQFEFQVQGLLEMINVVRNKTKTPDYVPKIVYLLVNKKPNSRIYDKQGSGKNSKYENPFPGSIIFEELSTNGYKQFHMASVSVNLGSCTPVSFKIGFEDGDVPLDAVAQLTYNQCYCYYNWSGAVRVPAALQYANKLAKLYSEMGQELVTEQKNSDLKLKPFFL